MSAQIKDGGAVDMLAENVEVRLWDSQWVNVVNHADCYRDMDKEEAIATAVRMTERLMAENITKGFPPSAYNRDAVDELIETLKCARDELSDLNSYYGAESVDQVIGRCDAILARVGGAK